MEKLLTYVVLLALVLAWVVLYEAAPGLQGFLTVISLCGVAIATRCRKPVEGR